MKVFHGGGLFPPLRAKESLVTQILTLITEAASKLTPCYNFMIRFPFHMHTANAARNCVHTKVIERAS